LTVNGLFQQVNGPDGYRQQYWNFRRQGRR
jgi:hypothetical protein